MHIERTATVHLPLSPAAALPWFTPSGERRWVAGWDPQPLHAPGGSIDVETAVFRTRVHGEETLWLVTRVDPGAGAADYVRITPGNRLGTVHVRCRAAGGGCSVEVTYRLTATSAAGGRALENITPERFAADIAGWQATIGSILASEAEG